MHFDKTWHLASTEEEVQITEFELQLWRVYYGFTRWQETCERCINNNELSSDELAVLHIIRMKDKAKTIADIGRLLNRDNPFSINYNISKLLKLGLIEKQESTNKKQHKYIITDKGIAHTDIYTKARRSLLINEFMKELQQLNLPEITNRLMRLRNIYEEASRVASLYQLSDTSVDNKSPAKTSKNNKHKNTKRD